MVLLPEDRERLIRYIDFMKSELSDSYKGILKELGITEHFDETFAENISRWAVLRNILAHEYLDIRWTTIKEFTQAAEPVYRTLLHKIESILKT